MIASESSVFRRLASNTLIPRWNALHSTNGVFSCMISLLMDTPPLIGKKAQRLSNVTRAASAVSRTVWLSGYVLYDCLDECGKCLALILLESRNTII